MTKQQKLLYLIQELLKENPRYAGYQIPIDTADQQKLFRTLVNLRPPSSASTEFLKIQDEYLTEELKRKGIVSIDTLTPISTDSRIILWQGDITRLRVDAIVNAANSAMLGCFVPCHGCIDNAIHTASGIQLRLECDHLMRKQGASEDTGKAKITSAYNLPSRYILHTVGPIVRGALTPKDELLLADCYRSCLELALENNLTSIAFCCISTGEFHFPNETAARIAIDTVQNFLNQHDQIEKAIFNVFTDNDYTIYQNLLN